MTVILCGAYKETNSEANGVEVYRQKGDTESGNSLPGTVKKMEENSRSTILKDS